MVECKRIYFEYNIFILVFCGQSILWTKRTEKESYVSKHIFEHNILEHFVFKYSLFELLNLVYSNIQPLLKVATKSCCFSKQSEVGKGVVLISIVEIFSNVGFRLVGFCCNLLLSSRDNSLKIFFCSVVRCTLLINQIDNVLNHS